MNDFFAAVNALTVLATRAPEAVRAIRIFGEHVIRGESIKEALLKTGEILAAESVI